MYCISTITASTYPRLGAQRLGQEDQYSAESALKNAGFGVMVTT